MKAAVLYGDEDIRYEEMAQPDLLPGTVKVRVRAAGICGSDIPRVFNHGAFFYPIVLGHEFSGDVTEVGEGVRNVKPGDTVVGAPLVPCMKCDDCLSGNYASCKPYSFMGSKQQGAFADYIVMPAMCAVKYDGSAISYQQAAMFEPATVALHGALHAGLRAGFDVAVLGGGTIGLFAVQWARIFGARTITVFDIDDQRLEFLRGFGATHTINTRRNNFMEEALKAVNGGGFPYVFETAGQPFTMNCAFKLAAVKSSVCFIGTPHVDLTFDPLTWELMNRKEFHLTGSWMSYSAPYPGKEWTLVGDYLKRGDLVISNDLINSQYPMSKAAEAFDLFKGGPVSGKVLLTNDL